MGLMITLTATAAWAGGCSSNSSDSMNGSGGVGGLGTDGTSGGNGGSSSSTGGAAGSDGGGGTDASSTGTATEAGTDQVPPMGRTNIESWLATGAYKSWHCEPSVHMARDPSPHGYNRICSNDVVASHVAWPRGAAAVKEIYDTLAAAQMSNAPTGYAVYLKTESDGANGSNWYWYERIGTTIYADGLGNPLLDGGDNPANTLCVGCHIAAGTPNHITSPGSSDLVYTPIGGPMTSADMTAGQTPPMGGASVEAWLATGEYKNWHCESAGHMARDPSPHGFNRICSNWLIAGNVDWPAGAAAVKELYAGPVDAGSEAAPVGYAVYLKTSADSAGGANWYWYERVPSDSPVPHDANGVVADGFGAPGDETNPAYSICVGCHAAAGTPAHTTSPGSRDQIYTAVP